jgi:Flp pilus assembly protein TadD
MRATLVTVSVIVMALLGHLTVRQIGVWKNSEVFWAYVADSLPNRYAQADFALGKYLSEKGMIKEAEEKYKLALQNDPDYIAALNALGFIYEGRGMYQDAVRYYRHAVESKPNYPNIHLIHNSLALIYIKTNQLEKAESALREALRLNSADAEVHSSLGILYHTMGRLQDAEREYKEAISLKFNHFTAHLNLGMLYKETGYFDKAMIEFKRDIYPDQFRETIQKLLTEISASSNPVTKN